MSPQKRQKTEDNGWGAPAASDGWGAPSSDGWGSAGKDAWGATTQNEVAAIPPTTTTEESRPMGPGMKYSTSSRTADTKFMNHSLSIAKGEEFDMQVELGKRRPNG